jgi:hypothetical protein
MIKAIIGIALIVWALWAGFGTDEANRARVFQGPVGILVNFILLLVGAGFLGWAFF